MADLYRKSSIEKLSNPEQLDRAVTITSSLSGLALVGVAIVLTAAILWSIFGTLPTTVTVNGIITSASDACAVCSDYTGNITKILKKAGDKVNTGDEVAWVRLNDGKEKSIVATENGTISKVLVTVDEPTYVGAELFRYTPDTGQDRIVICYVSSAYAGQLKKDMKVLLYPMSVDTQKNGHMEAWIESVGGYSVNTDNMWYVLGANNLVAEQFVSQGPVVAVACRIKTDSSTKSGYYWSGDNGKNITLSNGTFVSAKIVTDESAPITKLFHNIKDKLEGK